MNARIDHLDGIVSQSLANERKTGDELRTLITTLNGALTLGVEPEAREQLARDIEERFGISMGLGAMVDDEDFRPWLPEAKASIEPFYWGRYRKLMLRNGLPQDVVTATDTVTDEILGRLGNPNLQEEWDRRGMVVGHVQSGKTGNYTGLICKAADAGYRLIVVIAGIHNNLRNQTQERIDEGFIGRDTGRLAMKGKKEGSRAIGVGLFDDRRTPVSLTNTLTDFRKATATGNTSEIDSYKVPVVLVIKKNNSTLRNLLDWLRENSAKGDAQMISQPMLLIDDEADNASINTKYSKEEITAINGQIRDLLGMFHRSCYVGYTATPFANIFVDPDSYDEAKKEDLFPRHFIVGLDAPTNYFGAKKIFIDGLPEEGEPTWLRYISDNEDIIPIKHRIDQNFDELPDSLVEALRTFLIARTIRNLRGQTRSHCSMLVNASRFTNVQGKIRNRLHEKMDAILDSLRVNGARGSSGLGDPEIAALRQVWSEEYADIGIDWSDIQAAMLEAVAATKVVEVNSRANGLDYSDDGSIGQTLIAVGGFSLSRGLTLEGLTVTWFLRNTMMYDTLMQMGRWFGYRGGYEDVCRIWMPSDAIDWYAHIAEATDELHQELKKMQKAKATPADFGLAVRSHPASLMVTARNKMGSGQKHVMIGLSNAWVETAKISARPDDLARNEEAAVRFLGTLEAAGHSCESAGKVNGGYLLRGVDVEAIDDFLLAWRNHDQGFLTQTGPIRTYIRDRGQDELKDWDVLVTSVNSEVPAVELANWTIGPQVRRIGYADLAEHLLSISGKKARIASRGVEKIGVDPVKASEAEELYRNTEKIKNDIRVTYPDRIYRAVRDKPLFVLHVVQVRPAEGEDARHPYLDRIPGRPVIGWSISFPQSARPDQRVEYVINTVKFRELYGTDDEEPDEGALEDDD
ncbi:Z1 domain-containing protein [uncultured Jannaschia sp.]|uniref:Z1 domain-containing protein n=1 Tax=uncultured Jannaschia sp. TaxID=293347 RepID=UPI00261C94FC|nr:Z1 domain-containing protein [uncultured Jannaschia sp.]